MTHVRSGEIGAVIRTARNTKGLSLRKLATLADVDPGYLSQLENGAKNNPSPDTLEKIAGALDITLDELMLPEPRDYFVRKFDLSDDDANALVALVLAFVSNSKEEDNAKND